MPLSPVHSTMSCVPEGMLAALRGVLGEIRIFHCFRLPENIDKICDKNG